jgi:lysyl-tRNA synthetase, class II
MSDDHHSTEDDLIAQRREHLQALRDAGDAYRNDFRRDTLTAEIHKQYANSDKDELTEKKVRVQIAGRMMSRRVMGKASFAHIQDMSGQIQLFIRKDDVNEETYTEFKEFDLGDIIGAIGWVFITKTGELSVHVEELRLLTKSLRPLPEKFHGLTDLETRYRQRYLDLIANNETRNVFSIRSKTINFIRNYLDQCGYMEVETPMMHAVPGGAIARPFKTHHNALDMDLYLRIAPELYLKRLLVGGIEKVYEINRSFRNEGLSTQHNPEFSMLEFYQAYADYNDLMDLTEDLMRKLVTSIFEETVISYQGEKYDMGQPFQRLTLFDSVLHFNPDLKTSDIDNLENIRLTAEKLDIAIEKGFGLGKIQLEIFEKTVEQRLHGPVFIHAFPKEVSPLARCNDEDPFLTDRFELFIGGREIANGFSELNDPDDQAERFNKQVMEKEAGDQEAMHYDADYITALEYGMPPAAGEGIGIDRLVMLLTDSASIRDVILFPHMRPK